MPLQEENNELERRLVVDLRDIDARHHLLLGSWAQAVWETDANGVVVADSPSWRAYTGQTVEEWLGYGWLDAIHPDDRAIAERQWLEAITVQGLVNAEFRLRAPDGGWRWTNVRAAPVLDAGGSIEKWVALNIDIDARKRAEAALRESEEKYRSLFESMDEAYAVVEVIKDDAGDWADFRFLDANRAFMEHTSMPYPVGRTATEMLGSPNPRWTELYGRALDTGQPIRVEETEPALGRTFDLNIFTLDRERSRVAVLFTDVTARKRAEAVLRESEERQAFLLGLSDILQSLTAPDAIKSAAMHRLGEHLGVSRAQYHEVDGSGEYYSADGIGYADGLPLLDLRYRIDQFGSFVAEDFEAGRPFRSDDLSTDPRPTPQEREAYGLYGIRAGAGIPLLRGGKLVAILAVHDRHPHPWTDLEMGLIQETAERVWVAVEKVRTEIAVRENEERQAFLLKLSDRLRTEAHPRAIAATSVGLLADHMRLDRAYVAEVDKGRDLAEIGPEYRRPDLGPVEGVLTLSDFPEAFARVEAATLVLADTAADPTLSDLDRQGFTQLRMGALIVASARKGTDNPVWALLVATEEPRRWTAAEAALVEDVAERTWAAVERARVEAALRESEARLRALATAGGSIVYRMSPDWRLMRQLDGRDVLADTAEPAEDWAEGYILPEDRPTVFAAIEAAIRARSVFELEHRVRRADGGIAWVLSRAVPIPGADGEIAEWFGAATDITGRKQAEEALRTSEERLRTALSISTVGVMFWSGDGALVDANDAFLGMTGFTREEALGKTWVELTPPEFQERSARFVEEVERTGEGSPYEKQYYRRDGSRWWGLFAARKLGDGLVEFVLDVTGRRDAEAALHESEERFRSFAENSADTLWIIDARANRIEYLNPAFEPMWGEPREAIMADLGRWAELVHPEDRERATTGLPRLLAGEVLTQEYRIIRPSDGAVRWIRDTGSPIRDEAGRVTRVAGIAADVTERRRAEAQLAESEARFRQFGEASSDILWIRDAETLQWEYLTPAFETIYGASRDAALAGDSMRNWVELIHPEDRERAVASIDRVRHGERVTFEYRIRRPVDGEVRWLRNTDFPMLDDAGRMARIGGVGQDVTELKRVEAALQDSEGRLRTLMEGIPQLVWRSCDRGRWTWSSPQWCDFTGQSLEESTGLGWLEAIHPDDHGPTMQAWEAARPHGMLDVEYRVRRAADGAYLWHHTRSTPVRDASGRITEWLGTSTDIDDLRRLQDEQKVMVAELQHRTRNLIAVVRSVASQTMAETGPTEAFRTAFNDRMAALARVQGLLSRADETPITLEALIRMELDALGGLNGGAEHITLAGPPVRLRNSIVQTLALAIHELATNARKYGALAGNQGRLEVTWAVREADGEGRRVLLEWVEQGVDLALEEQSSATGGYGRELIERALPYALGARTRYELTGDGVRCGIDLPLERGRSRRSR